MLRLACPLHCPSAPSAASPPGEPSRFRRGFPELPARRRGVDSPVVNGSSNAAHFDVIHEDVQLSGLISPCSGEASKKYDGGGPRTDPAARCSSNQHGRRSAGRRPDPARALPRCAIVPGYRPSHRHRGRADIDAELERVRRDDSAHRPSASPFSISRRRCGRYPPRYPGSRAATGGPFEVVLQIRRQDLVVSRLGANTIACNRRLTNSAVIRRVSASRSADTELLIDDAG